LIYSVQFKASVKKDLRKIDRKEAKRILDSIEKDLASDPGKGTQLTGEFSGLYKYRIGNYRIIYDILRESILVLRIGHRKDVYK